MSRRFGWLAAALALVVLARPAPAAAHCDSMDGPVVVAAREALAAGDVTPTLAWVRPADEGAIRAAFQRTLRVRGAGGEARELADLWFFETLVRVHREGEGAPYTGLKPAGSGQSGGIAAADRALEAGSGDELAAGVAERAGTTVRERFRRVVELRERRDRHPRDVEAAREYVHAYVEYVHFVEKLHALLHGGAEEHAPAAEGGHVH